MLRSADDHYRRQQRITANGLSAAHSVRANLRRLVAVVSLYQRAAADEGASGVANMLAEQDMRGPVDGLVNPDRLAGIASDGRPLDSLLDIAQQSTDAAFDLIVATQLRDAGRVASGLAITARPAVQGYVRMLTPPSCPRCAILGGRFYRWSSGFDRHPGCDCRHIPSSEAGSGDLRTDPMAMFRAGQIRGLTQAETKAINEGADFGRVVNARRSRYVDPAGRRLTREATTRRGGVAGPRPMPEQIYREARDDREAAIRALKRFGYLF